MKPRQVRASSLFDVEEGVEGIQPHVRDMTVGPVSTKDVDDFCREFHYTNTGGSMMWRWGLWHGLVLHGVVAYNLPTKDVCVSVFGEESMQDNGATDDGPRNTSMFDDLTQSKGRWKPGGPGKIMNVLHMGRLVFADDSPRNSESRLIAASLKEIERTMPHIWGVITYADSSVGHIGYVYQATNALYTGIGGDSTYYIDQLGQRRGTYLNGDHIAPADARDRGWTVHRGGAKHRYIYILGSKTQRRQRRTLLKYPVLPYPKEAK